MILIKFVRKTNFGHTSNFKQGNSPYFFGFKIWPNPIFVCSKFLSYSFGPDKFPAIFFGSFNFCITQLNPQKPFFCFLHLESFYIFGCNIGPFYFLGFEFRVILFFLQLKFFLGRALCQRNACLPPPIGKSCYGSAREMYIYYI